MNKSEKQTLLNNYAYYCRAYKNNIVDKESKKVARDMIDDIFDRKTIVQVENNVEWEDYPAILHRFDFIAECIQYRMKDYHIFEYNLDSLKFIKDDIPFYTESETQANAIISQIDDLIVRINCREKVF